MVVCFPVSNKMRVNLCSRKDNDEKFGERRCFLEKELNLFPFLELPFYSLSESSKKEGKIIGRLEKGKEILQTSSSSCNLFWISWIFKIGWKMRFLTMPLFPAWLSISKVFLNHGKFRIARRKCSIKNPGCDIDGYIEIWITVLQQLL